MVPELLSEPRLRVSVPESSMVPLLLAVSLVSVRLAPAVDLDLIGIDQGAAGDGGGAGDRFQRAGIVQRAEADRSVIEIERGGAAHIDGAGVAERAEVEGERAGIVDGAAAAGGLAGQRQAGASSRP